jgi:hypothetical protein
VVSSEIIESSFDAAKLAIIGSYTKAQATQLASRIARS